MKSSLDEAADLLGQLLQRGMDPNITAFHAGVGSDKALEVAVQHASDVRIVELLLRAGARADRQLKRNLLWLAAGNEKMDPSVVKLLAHAKADLGEDLSSLPLRKDDGGDWYVLDTPLLRSLSRGVRMLRELLDVGMDGHNSMIISRSVFDPKVCCSHFSSIRRLIKSGPPPMDAHVMSFFFFVSS